MNENESSRKYKRVSLLLFSLAIVLGSVSINFAELKIGTYGLIHSLPPTFFVALFLLTLSFLITVRFNPKNKVYLFIHIIALVVLLYLLPALIEKTARFTHVYVIYGSTDYVLQHGHLKFFSGTIGALFQEWPGMTLLGASVMQVANLSPTSILIGFPVAFELICLPLLYLILNSVTKNQRLVWIALWLYFAAGWINRAYYSAQAYGYLLFLMIVFVILYSVMKKGEIRSTENGAIPIILIVLFIAIAAGHLLSSIVAVVCLVILYVLFRIVKVRGARRFGFVIPVFLVAIVVWLLLPAGPTFFKGILPAVRDLESLDYGAIFKSTFQVPFLGGPEHANIMFFRAIYTGVFCGLALLGLLYATIRKRMHLNSIVMLGLLLGACSIILFVGSYGGEIVYRAFELSLLFLAFFAAKSLGSKALSIPLVVFLLVSPALFVASAYANEKADYVSPAEIKGVEFFHDHVDADAKIYSFWIRIWNSKDIERNRWRNRWRSLNLEAVCTTGDGTPGSDESKRYFLLGERDIDARVFLGGDLDVDIEHVRDVFESSCRAKIYSSEGFELYR